jgi:hypothetical protein
MADNLHPDAAAEQYEIRKKTRGSYKPKEDRRPHVPNPIREEEVACETTLEQPSMAPSTLWEPTNMLSTSDPQTSPSSQAHCSYAGAAFFLAPSLMQAMQDMPHACSTLTPTFDTTEEPSMLDSNIADHSDHISGKSMQNKQVAGSSFNNTSTPEDSQQAFAERLTRHHEKLEELHELAIELNRPKQRQAIEDAVDKIVEKMCPRNHSSEVEVRFLNEVIESMHQQLSKKNLELGEAQKYNTELRKRFRRDLDEVQNKLKKNDIYIKSLDEYVDELETKIGLLETPTNETPAEQAQGATKTETTTVSNPVQQTNQQEQNAPVGDATYRWQAYLIECLQKEKEHLIETYQELKMKEDRAFKDAIHFERRLNNNMRAIDEHMRICHESKAFLNRDMTKNLLEMQAICDDKDEDRSRFVYDNADGKVSVSAVVEPESTQAQHREACADACNSQSPTIDDVGDGEEGEAEEGRENKEVVEKQSQSSGCGSDWSTVSMSEGSEAE